jgi:uncharacterized protein YdaU (DUF1376 family)
MHYYKRNIGDYAKKAGRLSMLQHGSYTLLIDACYDREQFPTKEEAIEWTWASTTAEIEAVEFVLRKFFTLEDGVYVQKRIQEEIAEYHLKADTNKRIANERETKRKEKRTNRTPDVNEPPPNQEPLTKNQEPNISVAKATEGDSKLPPCPHEQIINAYHDALPQLPRVREWNPTRQGYLRQRWKDHPDLGYWQKFFYYVAKSDFLTGRADGRGGAPPFVADLEWLIRPTNFTKVIEGKYHREAA